MSNEEIKVGDMVFYPEAPEVYYKVVGAHNDLLWVVYEKNGHYRTAMKGEVRLADLRGDILRALRKHSGVLQAARTSENRNTRDLNAFWVELSSEWIGRRTMDERVDAMCERAGMETLESLVDKLKVLDPSFEVRFKWPDGMTKQEVFLTEHKTLDEDFKDTDEWPGMISSYRGYYRFVAVQPCSEPVSVDDFLDEVSDSIGTVFFGYKGGEFYMRPQTPVWVDYFGKSNGYGITDVIEDAENKTVWLVVSNIESLREEKN